MNRLSAVMLRSGASALLLASLLILLSGCAQSTPPGGVSGGSAGQSTLELPTPKPTVAPSPVSTRVMPAEVLTPPPTATITPIPAEALGLVVEVLNGNTIAVVMDGDPPDLAYQVRYLGIEVPDPTEPWGTVALETNKRLANLKVVRLVRDQTEMDDEGYLLRYVYADGEMLNVALVEQGLAQADVQSPDTEFRSQIEAAEQRARSNEVGLWSGATPTPTAALATATPPPREEPTSEVEPTTEPDSSPAPASTRPLSRVTRTPTPTSEATAEPTLEPTGESTEEP